MSVGKIVKLDVGGTIFKTSKATLTKFSGFFRALMETDIPPTEDESGAIFIDRSPKHFERILNFMRDGHVDLPESAEDVKQIRNEAEYYLLDGLLELCKERVSRMLNFIKTSDDLLQLIAKIEKRPLVVINCATDQCGKFIRFPDGFQCWNFVQEFQDRYDIYFRSSIAQRKNWYVQVFAETQKCVYSSPLRYMLDCNWRLRNNLAHLPDSRSEMFNPFVKINVRGKLFQAFESTLTKFPGYFRTLFESDDAVDDYETIFVDRDPALFRIILNFMRESVTLPESADELKRLQEEATFFGLDGLVEMCKAEKAKKFVIRHVHSLEEEQAAVWESEKKAVMIVIYSPNGEPDGIQVARCILKYRPILDVFFRSDSSNTSVVQCRVYDKTTSNNFQYKFEDYEQRLEQDCAHLMT